MTIRHGVVFLPRRRGVSRSVIHEMFAKRLLFIRDVVNGHYEVLWDVHTAATVHDLLTHLVGPGDRPVSEREAWQRTAAFDVITGWGPLHAFTTLPRTSAENDNTSERQVRAATIGLLGASIALAIAHNESHVPGEQVNVQYAIDLLDELHAGDAHYAVHEIAEVGRRVREAVQRAERVEFIDPPTGHEN